MNRLPAFSVVICNYNYARFVGEALQSALDQDYPEDKVQVVVVDDGSTDESRSVYARFANEPRVHTVIQQNRGQTAAFAAGIKEATGDYVCLLDSDDVFLPSKLSRVAARITDLAEPADNLFLCHDLNVDDTSSAPSVRREQSCTSRVPSAHAGNTRQAVELPWLRNRVRSGERCRRCTDRLDYDQDHRSADPVLVVGHD